MNVEMLKKLDKEEVYGLAQAFGIEEEVWVDFDYLCAYVAHKLSKD